MNLTPFPADPGSAGSAAAYGASNPLKKILGIGDRSKPRARR